MILVPTVLAVLAVLAASFLAWREYRRTEELFTPWLLFLAYATLDVFLPAAIFLLTEPPSLTDWIVPLRKDDIASSTLIYVVSLAFFAAGYFFTSHGQANHTGRGLVRTLETVWLKRRHIYFGLAISATWYIAYQVTLIQEAGSFDLYVSERFRQRLQLNIFTADHPLDFVFHQFAPSMLPVFLMLVGVLFFFRHRCRRPVLWGWILPALAWALTLTTFYRGYQLNFFLSLAFIETYRLRVARLHLDGEPERPARTREVSSITLHTKILAGAAVVLFLLYGAYRQYNSSFHYGSPVSMSEAAAAQGGELVRGWGVVGLTSIIYAYPDGQSHLGGTSLATTLFMPVPRPLWPGKPERYGAEEVTRRMGWPVTTQSAITMPGELYANFGLVGLPLLAGFGFLFRAIYRGRLHPRLFFVYAFFVPHSVLLTHWMSSTGFMTTVTLYSPCVLAAFLVIVVGKSDGGEVPESDARLEKSLISGRSHVAKQLHRTSLRHPPSGVGIGGVR